MRHLLHICLLLVLCTGICGAQPDHMEHRFERIHAIKVAYITDALKLKPDESARFWPIYNRYEDEKRDLRKNFFKKYAKDGSHLSHDDGQAMRYVEDDLDYQEQELNLRRRYKDQLLKVLTPDQLAGLYRAEREFKLMLLQQLSNHHGGMRGR